MARILLFLLVATPQTEAKSADVIHWDCHELVRSGYGIGISTNGRYHFMSLTSDEKSLARFKISQIDRYSSFTSDVQAWAEYDGGWQPGPLKVDGAPIIFPRHPGNLSDITGYRPGGQHSLDMMKGVAFNLVFENTNGSLRMLDGSALADYYSFCNGAGEPHGAVYWRDPKTCPGHEQRVDLWMVKKK